MSDFKFFKYDTSNEEKKLVEEALVAKMAKWKYCPKEQIKIVLDILSKTITHHWDNALNVVRDIREQILRQLMPTISNKEVKESVNMNEQKLTPKFNAFLILSKDIESIVHSNIISWKNIYGLHKPTKEVVQIDDVEKDDEEINDNVDEEVNNEEDEED